MNRTKTNRWPLKRSHLDISWTWHLLSVPICLTWCLLSLDTGYAAEEPLGPGEDIPAAIRSWYSEHEKELVEQYSWLHSHPEVSLAEEKTSARLAEAWRRFGYEVTEKVGGFGIVGVLKNGSGPCVMLRTDLDALPVQERTGLPFASKATTRTADGATSGVMHACGHDLHMTNLTGAAEYLASHRDQWHGTLVLIGQPAEERGLGAKAMLNDGLYTRFPKPDFALALHVESATPSGMVSLRPGYMLANVDSVDIRLRGRGGHGASPEATVDPIVQAAELVLSLQSIVSREIKPVEPAVVTVGSIHGGTKHNIIGDSCHLQLTVRSYSPKVRKAILDAIQRRAKGVAMACNAPEPEIAFSDSTPALENDRELTAKVTRVFERVLGKEKVFEAEAVMGGEDFSHYGLAGVPIVMYRLGVISKDRLDRYQKQGLPIPSLHSPEFYPDLEGSLETGIVTMVSAALELLHE